MPSFISFYRVSHINNRITMQQAHRNEVSLPSRLPTKGVARTPGNEVVVQIWRWALSASPI
jgi:hypothetical protein